MLDRSTRINCQWTSCIHNDSECISDKQGLCNRHTVTLEHIDLEGTTESYMDCKSYTCDKTKKYK